MDADRQPCPTPGSSTELTILATTPIKLSAHVTSKKHSRTLSDPHSTHKGRHTQRALHTIPLNYSDDDAREAYLDSIGALADADAESDFDMSDTAKMEILPQPMPPPKPAPGQAIAIRAKSEKRKRLAEASPKPSRNRRTYFSIHDYEPLPNERTAIRVLHLFPNRVSDAVPLCELVVLASGLQDQVKYEALSWCWGTERRTAEIQLRTVEDLPLIKKVQSNLVDALKALRYATRLRVLWIDALCINQDDLQEKNAQVGVMDEIYSKAQRVCIWLGLSDRSSSEAFHFACNELKHLEDFDILRTDVVRWAPLLFLMRRPWFTRRWVVQEIALARKAVLYCGTDKMSWGQFATAVELFLEAESAKLGQTPVAESFGSVSALPASLLVKATAKLFGAVRKDPLTVTDRPESDSSVSENDTSEESDDETRHINAVALDATHVSMISESESRAQPLLSLEYLMSTLNAFKTTVPHDTIYALLSIAQDAMPTANFTRAGQGPSSSVLSCMTTLVPRKQFAIDYSRPFLDVCKEFVEFCVRGAKRDDRHRALDVICRPWACKQEDLDRRRRDIEEQRLLKRKDRGQYKTHDRIPSSDLYTMSRRNRAVLQASMLGEGVLPSWIPQLGNAPFEMVHIRDSQSPGIFRINADILVGLPSPERSLYSASGTSKVDLRALKFRKRLASKSILDYFSLFTKGFVLDTISHVGDIAKEGHIPVSWKELVGWTKGSPPVALWSILVANRNSTGALPPSFWQKACEEAFRSREPTSTSIDTTKLMQLGHNSLVSEYCRRVQAATWNRVLVNTQNGHLALASKDVRSGDKLCILFGCSVPVILRPSVQKSDILIHDEVDNELQHIANTIKRGWKRYVLYKKQHQHRKTIAMVELCRQWLKEADWLRINGGTEEDAEEAANTGGARTIESLVSRANESFNHWRNLARVHRWRESQNAVDAGLEVQVVDAQHDGVISSASSESTLGHNRQQNESCSICNPRVLDWLEFELALAAGRHWKREVKKIKASRSAHAMTLATPVWQSEKLKKYYDFRVARARPKGSIEPIRLHDHDQLFSKLKNTQMWAMPARPSFSPPRLLVVRPGWVRQHGEPQVLLPQERDDYEATFRKKMRDRLGEDACFSYEFLGEAYVHGMMDGEAVKTRGRDEREILFEIR